MGWVEDKNSIQWTDKDGTVWSAQPERCDVCGHHYKLYYIADYSGSHEPDRSKLLCLRCVKKCKLKKKDPLEDEQ